MIQNIFINPIKLVFLFLCFVLFIYYYLPLRNSAFSGSLRFKRLALLNKNVVFDLFNLNTFLHY
jgi:hypothetical protein